MEIGKYYVSTIDEDIVKLTGFDYVEDLIVLEIIQDRRLCWGEKSDNFVNYLPKRRFSGEYRRLTKLEEVLYL